MPTYEMYIRNTPIMKFVPLLASQIGDKEHMLFLQIEFWLRNPFAQMTTREIDGFTWLRASSKTIHQALSPPGATAPWGERTTRTKLKDLRDDHNLLISRTDLNTNPHDTTPWWCINYKKANDLIGVQFMDADGKPVTTQPQLPSSGEHHDPPEHPSEGVTDQPDLPETQPMPATILAEGGGQNGQGGGQNGQGGGQNGHTRGGQNGQGSHIYNKKALNPETPNTPEGDTAALASTPPHRQTELDDLADALFKFTGYDRTLKRGHVYARAKELAAAGMTVLHIEEAITHWYREDWRGAKGDVPTPEEIIQVIGRIHQPVARPQSESDIDWSDFFEN